jgi:CHRD domain-containing protein
MRKLLIGTALVGVAVLALVGTTAFAGGDGPDFSAGLRGYQEVPAISTGGHGTFTANKKGHTLHYKLRYSGLSGTAFQAHIHFGQRSVSGGIAAFLCGGEGKPDCPAAGTVTGTVTAADVIGPDGQGIAPEEFAELLRAMRAGVSYANVHSMPAYPGGEIRGQIRFND